MAQGLCELFDQLWNEDIKTVPSTASSSNCCLILLSCQPGILPGNSPRAKEGEQILHWIKFLQRELNAQLADVTLSYQNPFTHEKNVLLCIRALQTSCCNLCCGHSHFYHLASCSLQLSHTTQRQVRKDFTATLGRLWWHWTQPDRHPAQIVLHMARPFHTSFCPFPLSSFPVSTF